MRVLGPDQSLRRHDLELLYSGARCKAHPDAKVVAIGDEFLEQRKVLSTMRTEFEAIEDAETIADALVAMKDWFRDRSLVTLGALVDAIHPGDRALIFAKPPSETARLGYDEESKAIDKIVAKKLLVSGFLGEELKKIENIRIASESIRKLI